MCSRLSDWMEKLQLSQVCMIRDIEVTIAEMTSGGARGIGLEVSRGLAEAGANVRSFVCNPELY